MPERLTTPERRATLASRCLPGWAYERVFLPALGDAERAAPAVRPLRRRLLVARLLATTLVVVAHEWSRRLRGRSSLAGRAVTVVVDRQGHGSSIHRHPRRRAGLPPSSDQESILQSVAQDFRFAFRSLTSRRASSALVVVILALGIGATTVMFSLVDGVVLRPLPYYEPDRLVYLTETDTADVEEREASVTAGGAVAWRARARSFDGMSAYRTSSFSLVQDGASERVNGLVVSGNFFAVLGVHLAQGRGFAEAALREQPEVVISYGMWQQRFGGQLATDEVLRLGNESFRIVGVLPPAFAFFGEHDLVTAAPFDIPRPPIDIGDDYLSDFSIGYLDVVARLSPGTTFAAANEEMLAIAERLGEEFPEDQADRGVVMRPLHEMLVGDVRAPLTGLVVAVGMVLLIACANIAGLLLARASSRRREIAVRAALGATRLRVFRQMVAESLVLAALGGAAGMVIAWSGTRLVVAALPASLPRAAEISVDLRVLGFALLISAAAGVLFGCAPALQASRSGVGVALTSTRGTGGDRSSSRLRGLLVVAELALAVVLVVGAGMTLRSLGNLLAAEAGFEPEGLLAARLSLAEDRYVEDAEIRGFYDESLRRIRALPGVESAGLTLALPFTGAAANLSVMLDSESAEASDGHSAVFQTASTDYFRTMRIPVLAGRGFLPEDDADGEGVVIVSDEFVRRYIPSDRDPLTVQLHFGDDELVRIVGVVGSVRHHGYAAELVPEFYGPVAQIPWRFAAIMVRGRGELAELAGPVRQAIQEVDPLQAIHDIQPMTSVLSRSLAQPRFVAVLLGAFAVAALLLAAVGIFGLVSYSVRERVGEFGIRMALGARSESVLLLVLRQGITLLLPGLGLGILGAAATTRLAASLLHQVSPADSLVYASACTVLTMATLLACWLPARRATRVDPATALR